jgi:hypothetical protein
MNSHIPKVDPLLLTKCVDAIDAAYERDQIAFDSDFVTVMSEAVMAEVRGDKCLALAILARITQLVGCIGEDPEMIELFGGPNSKIIPRPLVYAAAVASLRKTGAFSSAVIRRTALRLVEPRGHA